MDILLFYIYLTLGFSCGAALFLRFRKWRSERITPISRAWGRLPIFGVFASLLYALWDASPENFVLGFISNFLHRFASSFAGLAFAVLLKPSFKLFHVNRPRYTQFNLLLAGICLLMVITTPVQEFAARWSGHVPDFPARDPSSSSDLGRESNVDTGRWPELPGAFPHPGSTLSVTPETQQFMKGIPPEELAKALQEIDESITSDYVSELRQKGTVEYTNKNPGPDRQMSLHDEASESHDEDPDLTFHLVLTVIFEIARWGSVVVKTVLVAISLNLWRIGRKTESVNLQLASWLVGGTVIVLLQEPHLINLCLTFTARSAHITRRIHATLDPIFFTLMYECITEIGYWQHEYNSEEVEDTGRYGSSVLGRILGFNELFTRSILNFFKFD